MKTLALTTSLTLLFICTSAAPMRADTVCLANGDMLRGDVVSLDQEEMKLKSENFGELTIPRTKVEAIYLGDVQPPTVPSTTQAVPGSPQTSPAAPSLQSPQLQQQLGPMLNKLLGGADVQDLQKNAAQAREGLQDLKKDMQGPESQALDAYIDILDLLAPAQSQKPQKTRPRQPRQAEKSPAEKPASKE